MGICFFGLGQCKPKSTTPANTLNTKGGPGTQKKFAVHENVQELFVNADGPDYGEQKANLTINARKNGGKINIGNTERYEINVIGSANNDHLHVGPDAKNSIINFYPGHGKNDTLELDGNDWKVLLPGDRNNKDHAFVNDTTGTKVFLKTYIPGNNWAPENTFMGDKKIIFQGNTGYYELNR
ncbi:MAG: hypothetical protein VKJ06_05930 [Vampirovibrionales bacterium]|nr:hypothetical protein [Vampirovibrionales bacterium]